MNCFSTRDGHLMVEDVSLEAIASHAGTPVYIYSQKALTEAYSQLRQAFTKLDPVICFAVKANASRAILALLAAQGSGADIVSGGELERALRAGMPARKIVFSGVGKTAEEMRLALQAGILLFNLESEQEMFLLNEIAGSMGVKAPVGFRVNPDVDAKTHPKITTGLAENKFGLSVSSALEQYQLAANLPNLEVKGISCHIGSQITELSPFKDALDRLLNLVLKLESFNIKLQYLDMGGGLGIRYDQEDPPTFAEYAQALEERANTLNLRLVLELGRSLVGNAGLLLTKVLYTKQNGAKHFVVVDAAMNDLMRPTMYDSFHAIVPVIGKHGAGTIVDVVGPVCESGDFLAKDRKLAPVESGDLLAVMSAGAYGFTMSSNYNSRPRAAEVMVKGKDWQVIKSRETIDDLCRHESLPDWM